MARAARISTPEPHSVAMARAHLGLTEAGAAALMRARVTGRLQGGVAADKLVADGFARRFNGGPSFGRPVFVTPKGQHAQAVLVQAGWRWR